MRPLKASALAVAVAFVPACAPANYLYGFDLVDPGAQNYTDFRRPDSIEDADAKVELRADPGEFKAVALDVTNKTEQPLFVRWNEISIVAPDHSQSPLRPAADLGAVDPSAKVSAVLTPFALPTVGPAAKSYDGTTFEIVIPMMVRGVPREYRYHLRATLKKI